MPNWCLQVLYVNHESRSKIEELRQAIQQDKMMNYIIPEPAEWLSLENTRDAHEIQERKEKNVQLIGHPTITEWQYFTRGTKWDIHGGNTGIIRKRDAKFYLKATFETAWSPPYETFEAMRNTHKFNVRVFYYEPLMDFCGKYDNGKNQQWSPSEDEIPQEVKVHFETEIEIIKSAENISEL